MQLNNKTPKQIKNDFKKQAQKNPSKYYPVSVLKNNGFIRRQCNICKNYFWTQNPDDVICGDAKCIGKYTFLNKKKIRNIEYIDVWKKFAKFFENKNYAAIKPYPCVARWRDDMDFTIASIADFQPYVVSGEILPPARQLTIPQFCLRFSDIDNVGITGRHYTGFSMIGQHVFEKKHDFRQEQYFCDLLDWFLDIGFKKNDLIIHEDTWAGGGNMGPSMEFFCGGLELANQVYMKYDINNGQMNDLNINVLDMGLGQERIAWFGNTNKTSYECTFPTAINYFSKKNIFKNTKGEEKILSLFLPYSGVFDFDEGKNQNYLWKKQAEKINIDEYILKKIILKNAAVYSILDHTRSILMALSDGALFSNTGGGYNLRVIFRRVMNLAEKYNFDFDFLSVFERHRNYLEEQYPALKQDFDEIKEIIKNEEEKYKIQKTRTKTIIEQLREKYKNKEIQEKELITLYQSKGIDIEELEKNNIIKSIPQNFYSKLSQIDISKKQIEKTTEIKQNLTEFAKNIPLTIQTYKFDWTNTKTNAIVLKSKDVFLICDKTCFYATSGGQKNDVGELYVNEKKTANIIDAININGVIVHILDKKINLDKDMKIDLKADFDKRAAITFNHTATHIINACARKILGNHIWQCGANKDENKARLDITHYELLRDDQIEKIEDLANEIIDKDMKINIEFMPRNKAEEKYGFRIYQGGSVPKTHLRIVKIGNIDAQACGGTHLDKTGRLKLIKIIGQKKIQDGVVRLIFTSGNSALKYIKENERILNNCCNILNIKKDKLPKTINRFFEEWKRQRKEIKKLLLRKS